MVQKERVKGIEPSLSVWKTDVLPLNYTRKILGSILSNLYALMRVI